jgi:DNA-binding winged helix-turn-helix (wHTH) protein/tetratricopeptide (TPR) repeat protein
MTTNGDEIYRFGPFELDARRKHLLRDGKVIPLQPKAFETLVILVRNSGALVLKRDLLDTVWGHTVVEESNVSQNIFILRKALGDDAHHYIATVSGRGYRFESKVEVASSAPEAIDQPSLPAASQIAQARGRLFLAAPSVILGISALALALLLAGVRYWYLHRSARLSEKDTVVLADFVNSTGDPLFDDALREGLSAQLEQSPFLNLLSDQQIAQTVQLMARPKGARLTREVANDVCRRTASRAVLYGTISQVGTQYILTLKAVTCTGGDTLANIEARASDKNHVLDALSTMAAAIRTKLGESLASLAKFDTPLESVTTPSLEALQAYSLGVGAVIAKRDPQAIALFEHAINLDPNFAMAYMRLGTHYFNMDETARAAEYLKKAYTLREHTSEREKLHIAANYAAIVTRDLEASRKTLEVWIELYPRDWRAWGNLCTIYGFLAEYEKGLAAGETALKLAPDNVLNYSNLIISLLQLNRLDAAARVAEEAKIRALDSPFIHANLYLIAFLKRDAIQMAQEVKGVMATPGWEDLVLYNESDTAAFAGEFSAARDFTQRAAEAAVKAERTETMAAYVAEGAVREALVGNSLLAATHAKRALSFSNGRDVVAMSALSLASSDPVLAGRLAADIEARFPEDTIVKFNSVPMIRAAIALQKGDAAEALDALAAAKRYELGQTSQLVTFTLYPIYFRGLALLKANQSLAAAAQFQKLIDHPGLVQNQLIGALAYLGLGRARASSGDGPAALSAYRSFFSLWERADADLPPLREARAEIAKIDSH